MLINLLSLHYYLEFELLILKILIIIQFNYFDLEFLVLYFRVFNFRIVPASAKVIQLLKNLYSTTELN